MSLPQANSLIDLFSPEDKKKHAKREDTLEEIRSNSVTREWLGIAELGYYYGWGAIKDLADDVITLEQADMLVASARKLHSGQVLDQAMAVMAGNSTKKGGFKKVMKPYINDMQVNSV